MSHINGKVTSIRLNDEGYEVTVRSSTINDEEIYRVPLNSIFRVKEGDTVRAGDKITDGSINIAELLQVAGIAAARDYMLKEIQKVYRIQGIEISDKYVEIILRQMTNKVKVLNRGDSNFFIGQVIDINTFTQTNIELISNNQTPITACNLIFGLEIVPSKVDSFLSAASFQDTKKILIDSAARSQTDALRGLKENVMLGNLIPAGTGLADKEQMEKDGQKMYKKEY
ncbi:MAG: hypothetical protein K2M43_01300 [Mycoplasmoidaceae bacterium]|nr:hypothetical protein [Mycoplasmoidaceae bacterium]